MKNKKSTKYAPEIRPYDYIKPCISESKILVLKNRNIHNYIYYNYQCTQIKDLVINVSLFLRHTSFVHYRKYDYKLNVIGELLK